MSPLGFRLLTSNMCVADFAVVISLRVVDLYICYQRSRRGKTYGGQVSLRREESEAVPTANIP